MHTFIHGEKAWHHHSELRQELKFKQNDLKFQNTELENAFSKGVYTSYGDENLNDQLFKTYGVKVKLQNGKIIQNRVALMWYITSLMIFCLIKLCRVTGTGLYGPVLIPYEFQFV